MIKLTKIDLASQLSQGYYAGNGNHPSESTVILNFIHCFVIRTEVVGTIPWTDVLNKTEFVGRMVSTIFYLVSESLSAVKVAEVNSHFGIIWSIFQNEVKKVFGLTSDDIYLIECEVSYYQESGELLSEAILGRKK